ncbi:MAG: helix-turn-helix transcriptional regulator [Lunatimonas sp.]|uniref:helix-turn-helix transcriptional regulator n=1 Tax=Lunatimonas sp. TaxID=2060141 RepID=UPI002A3C1115|nr:helix-turn-helix transcriptional regulator [Lunatimonas sp.]
MAKPNVAYIQMSGTAIVDHIGRFIKDTRAKQNRTEAHLAENSGLNRWTISQIDSGESITLSSLILILRALDSVYVLEGFKLRRGNKSLGPCQT